MFEFVRQGSKDPLHYTLMVDFDEVTPDSVTVEIFKPNGENVRAASSLYVTNIDAKATLKQEWTKADYPLDVCSTSRPYRARWVFIVGSDTYERDTYFVVSKRDFTSQVTDKVVFAEAPSVKRQSSSLENGLKELRASAWDDIKRELGGVLMDSPSLAVDPTAFHKAHVYLTISKFYLDQRFGSLGDGDEPAFKSEQFFTKYQQEFSRAINTLSVDTNNDNIVSASELRKPVRKVKFLK